MRVLISVIFVLVITNITFSQETEDKKIGVWLSVSANEKIKGKIESYVKRELREFPDVCVHTLDINSMTVGCLAKKDIYINIVALELATKSDIIYGYALSTTVEVDFYEDLYNSIFEDYGNLTLKNIEKISDVLNIYSLYLKYKVIHYLRITDIDGLKKLCQGIIADVDSEVFESYR